MDAQRKLYVAVIVPSVPSIRMSRNAIQTMALSTSSPFLRAGHAALRDKTSQPTHVVVAAGKALSTRPNMPIDG